MKLTKIFGVLLCGVLALSSCSDDNDNVPEANENVPTQVLQSFTKLYGNVTDVKWEQKNNYHVARFNGKKLSRAGKSYNTSAWFTNDGKHCQADQDIEFENIPVLVKDAFNAYKELFYPDWERDDCEVVIRDGMSLIYVIEIEKGKLEREISISEQGDILKDVLDDDDDDDILPILIPEKLKDALMVLFPDTFDDILFLELEIDDDEIEVDIIENGKHKEIEFDLNYNWKSTEYDVTYSEALNFFAPEVWAELLNEIHELSGLDLEDLEIQKHVEIEVKNHYKKGWVMEIEIEIGDHEWEIKINKDGEIIKIS